MRQPFSRHLLLLVALGVVEVRAGEVAPAGRKSEEATIIALPPTVALTSRDGTAWLKPEERTDRTAAPEPIDMAISPADPIWTELGGASSRTFYAAPGGEKRCGQATAGNSIEDPAIKDDESFGPCQCHKEPGTPGCAYEQLFIAPGASTCSQVQQACIAYVQSLNVESCSDESSPICDHGTVCQKTYQASGCGSLTCNGQPCGLTVYCWSYWGCHYCD